MTLIAVIGCGEIGGPVARRLAQRGPVLACDSDPDRRAALQTDGVGVTGRVEDCQQAGCVLICVATDAQVLDVAGKLAGGVMDTVVVLSTVSPGTMQAVQATLVGCEVIDAPVSGGSAGAEAGTLTILAGGPAERLAALQPVFAAFAAHVVICGPLGAGQVTKILNNVICHANTVLMAEMLRLGSARGLNTKAIAAAMELGTGRNYLTAKPDDLAAFFHGFAANPARFGGLLAIFRKDLALAAQLAQGAQGDWSGVTALARTMLGLGDQTRADWATIAQADLRA